jgi:DDE superfamily endonuclease
VKKKLNSFRQRQRLFHNYSSMPRSSERADYISHLTSLNEDRSKFKEVRDKLQIKDSIEDDIDELLFLKLFSVKGNKYLGPRKKYRKEPTTFETDLIESPTSSNDDNQTHIQRAWLNDHEFLQKYRMKRESFYIIYNLIKNHPVFATSQKMGRKQSNPMYQFMTLLKYIGTEGSGAGNLGLRDLFKIGRGTAVLFRDRAVTAIRSLRDQAIYWPDEKEREDISARIRRDHCFPNCVGMIDGTLFPLARCPSTNDCPDYSGRKHQYSLSVIIINDDSRLIRYYISGWPGSAHDNRIFNNTPVTQKPHEYFTERQYLLGDSAFENSNHMVSSYKCPKGMELGQREELFNTALAKPRISSEHTIGMLKGRFPWLRSIRMQITEDKRSLAKILKYIDVCIILHTLLVKQKDPVLNEWLDKNDIQDPLNDEYNELNEQIPNHSAKDTRRKQLTNYICENFVYSTKTKPLNQKRKS